MTEMFSIDELNYVVSERLRPHHGRPHTSTTLRAMVDDVAGGLRLALASGYAQSLLVCGRLRGRSTCDFWVGPESDPRRPAWTREEDAVCVQT